MMRAALLPVCKCRNLSENNNGVRYFKRIFAFFVYLLFFSGIQSLKCQIELIGWVGDYFIIVIILLTQKVNDTNVE